MDYTNTIKQQALVLGFDLVGVTAADVLEDAQRKHFVQWLAKGNAAGMDYLRNNIEKRFDPDKLLEGAKSILCVALNYKPSQSIPAGPCRIADFALYEDYHEFIKQRLRVLAEFITQTVSEKSVQFKICVDSVPLAERALAQRAGLGWIGKNKSLIHPEFGCQLLLGELITTAELTPDEPFRENLCGDCVQCLRVCPTGALSDDDTFDGRKCISYLTIEHKGDIPSQLADKIGSRLFGCDQCISVCPFHKKAPTCSNKEFQFSHRRTTLRPENILNWIQEDFDSHFNNSSIKRLGLERLQRNAKICMENRPDRVQPE
jgi:epoxyqueuosine reductase